MPTLLTWVFEGGDADPDASATMQERAKRRGEKQRACAACSSRGPSNKNLMLWHSLATKVVDGKRTHLDCKEVPVMAILKEFREMAGIRGRNTHRGTTPPKYEYTVKVEVDKD